MITVSVDSAFYDEKERELAMAKIFLAAAVNPDGSVDTVMQTLAMNYADMVRHEIQEREREPIQRP